MLALILPAGVARDPRPNLGGLDDTAPVVAYVDLRQRASGVLLRVLLPQALSGTLHSSRVAIRVLPMPGPDSVGLAETIACASRLSKSSALLERVAFVMQVNTIGDEMLQPALENAAVLAGVPLGPLKTCVDTGEGMGIILRTRYEALRMGITGPPAVVIGGQPLMGLWPAAVYRGLLNSEDRIRTRGRFR